MGRPERHDADYFPFYVKDGKTLFILESKYGLQGIGFFTNLMRFLTRQTDHHICVKDESDRLYFFAQIRCAEDVGTDMLNLMAKTGKIDVELWQKNQVIVSQDLLDSLRDAYKNRNNPIIEIAQIRLSYHINEVSSPENPITSPSKPQRKGKERKGKESIYTDDFLTFWKAYPKKVGKDAAWRVWKARNGTRPDVADLVTAIRTQTQSNQWQKENGQYIPNPATWLNQGRWADEIGEQESGIDSWARKKQAEMEAQHGTI